MALNITQLAGGIQLAFKTPLWATCGILLGQAIDTFILSGTVSTVVTGIIVPPPPAAPYPLSGGIGTGTIIMTPGATGGVMSAKFSSPTSTWVDVGSTLASIIDGKVKTATVSTSVIGALTGFGFGNPGCINTAPTYPALIAQLTNAFVNMAFASLFEACATEIANAINIYLLGALVTTIDAGTIPPTSWSGQGIGNII